MKKLFFLFALITPLMAGQCMSPDPTLSPAEAEAQREQKIRAITEIIALNLNAWGVTVNGVIPEKYRDKLLALCSSLQALAVLRGTEKALDFGSKVNAACGAVIDLDTGLRRVIPIPAPKPKP